MNNRVSRALWVMALIFAVCFIAVGCEQAYRALGFTDQQAKALADRDRAKGEDAAIQSQDTFWQWVTMVITGVGATVSATLAKLLDREKTTVRAVVTGVENSSGDSVKKSIAFAAKTMGVEKHLNKVVEKVTRG